MGGGGARNGGQVALPECSPPCWDTLWRGIHFRVNISTIAATTDISIHSMGFQWKGNQAAIGHSNIAALCQATPNCSLSACGRSYLGICPEKNVQYNTESFTAGEGKRGEMAGWRAESDKSIRGLLACGSAQMFRTVCSINCHPGRCTPVDCSWGCTGAVNAISSEYTHLIALSTISHY